MVWNDCSERPNDRRAITAATTERVRRDGGAVPDLAMDTAFTLLSHHHRRELLLALREAPSNTLSLEGLISELGAGSAETAPDFLESRESLHVLLRHQHLPRLENAGVVTVADDETTITYVEHPRLETLLDVVEEWED